MVLVDSLVISMKSNYIESTVNDSFSPSNTRLVMHHILLIPFLFLFIYLSVKIYLFIFGWVGSSLLHVGFL